MTAHTAALGILVAASVLGLCSCQLPGLAYWPALYGDSGFAAFASPNVALPPANWSVVWNSTTAWSPLIQYGPPLALGDEAQVFIGLASSTTAAWGVGAFAGATGKKLWITTLDGTKNPGQPQALFVRSDGVVVAVVVDSLQSATYALLDPSSNGSYVGSGAIAGTIAAGSGFALSLDEWDVLTVSSAGFISRTSLASQSVHTVTTPKPSCGSISGWSLTPLPNSQAVYLACHVLYLVDFTTGSIVYTSPAAETTLTYSFNPANNFIYMNWKNRIVAVDPSSGSIVYSTNVSAGWVAHDTMIDPDPSRGTVYIPMNWTSPAGVSAYNPDLSLKWTLTLPAGHLPLTAMVQTIRSPFKGPNPGAVNGFSRTPGTLTDVDRLLVMDQLNGTVLSNATLPYSGYSLHGAISSDLNMIRVVSSGAGGEIVLNSFSTNV